MKFRFGSVVSGAVALGIVTASLVGGSAPAQAYTGNPPWVGTSGDTASVKGSIALYDSTGNVVTAGSDYNYFASWAESSSAHTANAELAQLDIAFPSHLNAVPSTWLTQSLVPSTNFVPTPAGTPAAINTAHAFVQTNLDLIPSPTPVLDALSNNASPDTTTGYDHVFELRMVDSGSTAFPDGKYWRVDIEYNNTASSLDGLAPGAWRQVYPAVVAKTATSVTTPLPSTPSPASHGVSLDLAATVSAADASHPAGSVHFFDGTTDLGVATTFTSSTGAASKTGLTPNDGPHSYTAVFTPTDLATYSGATSGALAFNVNGPADNTTITIVSTAPAGATDALTPVLVTAHVADSPTPASTPTGTVDVKADGATVATGTVDGVGNVTVTIPAGTLTIGAHSLSAVYTPSGNFNGSSTAGTTAYSITLPAPANFVAPAAGAARVGVVSVCNPGAWTYAGAYSYAWYLDAAVSPFSTSRTTAPLPWTYVGHKVKCTVTVSNPGNASVSATSSQVTVAAGAALRATVRPAIKGTPRVGKTLSAYRGVWSPSPTSYLYVWKVGSVVVSRATAWKPSAAYRGKLAVLSVYASHAGYLTGVASSVAVKIG